MINLYKNNIMNDKQKEKLDKFIAEVKNEGLNFQIFYTNKLEKLCTHH